MENQGAGCGIVWVQEMDCKIVVHKIHKCIFCIFKVSMLGILDRFVCVLIMSCNKSTLLFMKISYCFLLTKICKNVLAGFLNYVFIFISPSCLRNDEFTYIL